MCGDDWSFETKLAAVKKHFPLWDDWPTIPRLASLAVYFPLCVDDWGSLDQTALDKLVFLYVWGWLVFPNALVVID